MKLTPAEFTFMNTRNRQRAMSYEFDAFLKHLKKHGIDLTGKAILDAGCGPGFSTELISREFRPSRLAAFDLMPEMIDLARKREPSADFFVGDITATRLPSEIFDAVFIFDVLHHEPEWRKALQEMAHVLKPGGILLVEEPANLLVKLGNLFDMYHPPEAMFSWGEFKRGLISSGFEIIGNARLFLGLFRNYLCRKSGEIASLALQHDTLVLYHSGGHRVPEESGRVEQPNTKCHAEAIIREAEASGGEAGPP